MDYTPDNPLPIQEQRALEMYFNVESESMATDGYYSQSENVILRRNAVHFIVEHSKCAKFDAFIPYLAMSYFDRYISRHQLPKVETSKRDDVLLLAICCLSLSWKMRKKSFSITASLKEKKLKIDHPKMLRVELMILIGLDWRMRAVTAICFVGLFFNMIQTSHGFKRRTLNEIIIQAQGDITFTQFKPSVIAASALLAASSFLYPNEFESYKEIIANYEHVKAEDVTACLDLMTDMCKKMKIVMETAEPREGPRLRVQAGEPSGSTQPSQLAAPNEPPMDEPSGSSHEPSQPAPTESPLNFELKWVTNENEDLTIDRPLVSAEARDVDTETDVPTTGCSNYPKCCSVQ